MHTRTSKVRDPIAYGFRCANMHKNPQKLPPFDSKIDSHRFDGAAPCTSPPASHSVIQNSPKKRKANMPSAVPRA